MSSKRILVVGGAGYVGSVLVRELLDRGYAVRVLDRLYFGDAGLKEHRDRVDLVVGDMRMVGCSILDNIDSVVNIGGLSNDPTAEYNPKANEEMNTVAAETLANLCLSCGVRRYLFASSCSVYDRSFLNDGNDHLLDEESEIAPRTAYASSKYAAEKLLLDMTSDRFCPVILRKGTIYGFSPRMRYDLVVNTFVKDALSKGCITVHYGGEMWRPLVDVQDVAQAYITCLTVPEEKVKGQIFNIVYRNMRISELALRVRETLREMGITVEIRAAYTYRGVRTYRASGGKIQQELGFRPRVTVEEAVRTMVSKIREYGYDDFSNPRYDNIQWMRLLEDAAKVIAVTGSVFEVPGRDRTDIKIP